MGACALGKIRTVYVCNHTHTDIGFTDYQDLCFRQHAAFIDQALDLIEATDGHPAEARYKWTCETTGPLMRYLRAAGTGQIDRFRHWHDKGRIDVAAMQYNLTPLLNVEQMHRSLYPLRALRDEFGLTVQSAMQDDVNGVSWLFADLLADLGITFYTAAINPIRGARPKPFPGAFWWEGPSGKRVLAWNGYHYLFGRSQAGLGNFDLVDRLLPRWVEQLEADETYPYDFLYCESTHPVRVDNGPPDPRMPEFVKRWNGEERPFKFAFVTTSEFGRLLAEGHGNAIGTQRGDWTDHWTDGPGSSAYETGVNRATHEFLGMAEAIEAWLRSRGERHWDAPRAAATYENTTLYDEHTWGAYSSIEAPDSLFTRAQWNRKAGFAYTAAMEAHDQLAAAARKLAKPLGNPGPEGIFNLGDLTPEEAFKPSGIEEVLVINTLPWERQVIVEEPEPRGGAAPIGVLDCFFNRGSGWGGARPIPPVRRLAGTVPPMGYAFLKIAPPDASDLKVGPGVIENRHYRLRVDAKTGGLSELFDKELGHDFAGEYQGWRPGQYIYEEIDSPEGRLAINNYDFSHPDFFIGNKNTPWVRQTASKIEIGEPQIDQGRASITAEIEAPGVRRATVTYALDAGIKSVAVDWGLDKLHQPRSGGGVHRLPVQPRRGGFHHRPQRHSGRAQPGPVRWRGEGLVSAAALGRRERRQTRGDACAARRAARPSRRHHHRQVVAQARAGRPDHHVVGDQQSLDGELQGEPGRADPAPLPADDPCRHGRSSPGRTVRRRGTGAAGRPPRYRADRRAERQLLRRRLRGTRPCHRKARRGRRMGRAPPAKPLASVGASGGDLQRRTAGGKAERSDRAPRRRHRPSTAKRSRSNSRRSPSQPFW